jgi:hypothetical protein
MLLDRHRAEKAAKARFKETYVRMIIIPNILDLKVSAEREWRQKQLFRRLAYNRVTTIFHIPKTR